MKDGIISLLDVEVVTVSGGEIVRESKFMKTLIPYGLVALGGALGAIMRYWLGGVIAARLGTGFPYGTFIINITGSFMIGLILTLITERITVHPYWRLFFPIGFIGAYTTFSTFEYETFKAIEEKNWFIGILNVVGSVVLGFLVVWLGVIMARKM